MTTTTTRKPPAPTDFPTLYRREHTIASVHGGHCNQTKSTSYNDPR